MVRTRVGYTGGRIANPSYERMGDHSEAFQVDFDPKIVSYQRLLDVFWECHSPQIRSSSIQYRPALFYHNEQQKQLAVASVAALAQQRQINVETPLLQAGAFTLAEDYHQKYWLRCHSDLQADFQRLTPDPQDFVHSTAAMRINAALAGYRCTGLEQVIAELELSDNSRAALQLLAKAKR